MIKQLMEKENKLMEKEMFYLKQEAYLKATNKGIIDSAQSFESNQLKSALYA